MGPSHRLSCLSFPQPAQFSATLQHWLVWPNLLQSKQRIELGTNKATFTFRQPTVISFGRSGVLKVRNRVLVGTFSVSFFTVTLWTSTTPCSCSSVLISISVMPDSSRQRMTPRDEFSALWMETRTGLSTNRVVLRRPHHLRFPSALHLQRSNPQPFNAFEGSGHRLETLLDSKGRQFTQWEVVT